MAVEKAVLEELRRVVGREHFIESSNDLRIFERSDRMPSDEECQRWLRLLIVGAEAAEAPGLPGARTRRFEAFEHSPEREAPLA